MTFWKRKVRRIEIKLVTPGGGGERTGKKVQAGDFHSYTDGTEPNPDHGANYGTHRPLYQSGKFTVYKTS